MKLVQIQLKPSVPFWFIDDVVRLSQDNSKSEFIDVDSLSDEKQKIIEDSIRRYEINVYDCNGIKIYSLNEAIYISGDMVINTDDVKDTEEDLMPDIISVTIDDEEEEEEIEEENISLEPSEEHIENAKILLGRNGNTIKKMIKNMSQNNENLMLLYACAKVESKGKARKGVISVIDDAIAGY